MTNASTHANNPTTLGESSFKIDEPLHRPPDGYHLADSAAQWDPYALDDPDQIDDN